MPGRDKKQQLFERMERVVCDWITVRTWREMTFEELQSDAFIIRSREEIVASLGAARHNTLVSIAQAILELPHMNAVEVLDLAGNGIVVYADWP